MQVDINDLIKDITKIDTKDMLSEWKWLLDNQKEILLVSSMGDMFLLSNDNAVYWLDTGMAELTFVAETVEEFQTLLNNEETINNWLLPGLVIQLVEAGVTLSEDQVYSFKIPPILGGDFSINNFEPTNMSVHFSILGQIHKQIWDAKDGTKIDRVDLK